MCQPPPAGLGPSTSGLSEQIWTVLKWRRKSLSSILHRGQWLDPPRGARDPQITNPSTFLKQRPVPLSPPNSSDPQIAEPSSSPRFLQIPWRSGLQPPNIKTLTLGLSIANKHPSAPQCYQIYRNGPDGTKPPSCPMYYPLPTPFNPPKPPSSPNITNSSLTPPNRTQPQSYHHRDSFSL